MRIKLRRPTFNREPGRRRSATPLRLLAVLAALLAFVPGTVATADPAHARTAASNDCQKAADVLGLIGDAAGIVPVPGAGPASGLIGLLSDIGSGWLCGGESVAQQLTEIAIQQAQIVFEQNMVEIFDGNFNDEVERLENLPKLPDYPTDSDRQDRVAFLNGIWTSLSSLESTGGTLSFAALPGMTALAGVKMATLELAMETQTARLQSWRDLAAARTTEADDSIVFLNELKAKFDQHLNGRFTRHIQTFPNECATVWCYSRARIYVRDNYLKKTLYDSGVMSWSGIIAPKPPEQPEYKSALAHADNLVNTRTNQVRATYITPEFSTVMAALQAHKSTPNPPLFQLKEPRCNEGSYLILQSVTHDFLTVTARDGISSGTSLWMLGDLDFARSHDGSQFRPIRYGDSFLYQVRGIDLTMHTAGGSEAGHLIRLEGDRNFAEHHPESLFETYITANDQLIFKVSDRDLTIGLSNGEHTHSELVLNKPLAAAINDKSSRFRFHCYPDPKPRP
ncbi:hypothetical protein ACN27G_32240 [Plantactinospora sp. WMMB334]|uniref:hypothetical protein n=1 Tax=Plantactinospora sp. WMMB334 TaxID=3404119 RepID=UPI003B93B612